MRRHQYARNPRQPLWRRARATWGLIIANALWFFLVEPLHGFSGYGLVESGALFKPLVVAGQWYRLSTAMFVHMGLTHIALNMFSLASLYIIELIFGSPAFVAIYFMSGVLGNLCMLWIGPANSVSAGASGAIFGIFGVALMLSFQGVLPRAARNQLLFFLALNLVYGFSVKDVGNVAHIGGLLTGMGLTALRGKWSTHQNMVRVAGWSASILMALACIADLLGFL